MSDSTWSDALIDNSGTLSEILLIMIKLGIKVYGNYTNDDGNPVTEAEVIAIIKEWPDITDLFPGEDFTEEPEEDI